MRLPDLIRKMLPARVEKAAQPVNTWRPLHEPFTGAWQQGWKPEFTTSNLLAVPSVYACVTRIARDIGMLPFRLRERDSHGVWRTTTNPAFSPLLRKPNQHQTPAQFREAWTVSRLLHGNAYLLKEYDSRNVITALHVLDPARVQVMVTQAGDVFYRLHPSHEGGIAETVDVPDDAIIHDREPCLFHPMIGTPPLAAAAAAGEKHANIERGSTAFFGNLSRPGGLLTAPAGLKEEDADQLRRYWADNFSGRNAGKIAVLGADLKFTALANNATDSQLTEQLRLTDEEVARAFGVPSFLLGIGTLPAGLKIDELQQHYLATALQSRIEGMEDALDTALRLGDDVGVELDLAPLLRMDQQRLATTQAELVKAAILSPNEARRVFNLGPVTGGNAPLAQQQNYSLAALAKRDGKADPFASDAGKEVKAALAEVRDMVRRVETAQRSAPFDPHALRGRMLTRDMKPRMRWNEQFGGWQAVH